MYLHKIFVVETGREKDESIEKEKEFLDCRCYCRISYEKEFPDLVHQEEIEYRDERNAMIRTQAKAGSADIIQWFILLTAGLIFFSDCPLWPAVVLVGIYFLRSGIEYYYTQKYQKEM